MDTETKKPRLPYLDNIKLLFAILVIFQHARITYGGLGWWYYIETSLETDQLDPISIAFFILLIAVGGLFQSSLMGLFFLMGGYFIPKSYDRKGAITFWKERLLRLGIPLLLYIVLIDPIMKFLLAVLGIQPYDTYPNLQGSLLDYYSSLLVDIIDFLTSSGPMWFLYVLLLFTLGYTLWRQITKIEMLRQYIPEELSIPKYYYLIILAIALGCITFVVRLISPVDDFPLGIPLAFIIQYIMMFTVGVIAVRYDWFEKMTKDHIKNWFTIIMVTVILFFLYFFLFLDVESVFSMEGGATFHALVFAIVDNILCMGMIFVLIPVFKYKFNDQGNLLRKLSSSSYHMYLVHAPILVTVSLVFVSIPLFPVVKLAIVYPLTIILCFLVSHYILRRIL